MTIYRVKMTEKLSVTKKKKKGSGPCSRGATLALDQVLRNVDSLSEYLQVKVRHRVLTAWGLHRVTWFQERYYLLTWLVFHNEARLYRRQIFTLRTE